MIKTVTFLCIFSAFYCTNSSCWWKRSSIEQLIIGGKPAQIQDIPYQAAFFYYGYFFCSGSIVSKTQILTAAHCVAILDGNPEGLTVRVGSDKVYRGGQVVKVQKIIVHPKFSMNTTDYDAAIVELKEPLTFTDVVQPLPMGRREPKDGEEVRVSGWGFKSEIGPTSRRLQSVFVKVVNRQTCTENYKNILLITKRMMCASAENKDACYGDSGGPLVHKGVLIGIVSSGMGCARKDFPGIYTNVADPDIQKFIRKHIKYRKDCSK